MNSDKLKNLLNEFEKLYDEYIQKRKKFEELKLQYINPSIRDSIEKQLIKAFKEDKEFFNLHQEIEELRRNIDKLKILIDGYKIIIQSLN